MLRRACGRAIFLCGNRMGKPTLHLMDFGEKPAIENIRLFSIPSVRDCGYSASSPRWSLRLAATGYNAELASEFIRCGEVAWPNFRYSSLKKLTQESHGVID